MLALEVADVTLEFDREIKLPIYAENGISEYWRLNRSGFEAVELANNTRFGLAATLIWSTGWNAFVSAVLTARVNQRFEAVVGSGVEDARVTTTVTTSTCAPTVLCTASSRLNKTA